MKQQGSFIYLITIIVFLQLNAYAQNRGYSYYELGIVSERTPITELMSETYRKEIYVGDADAFYVKDSPTRVDIIQYDANKKPTRFFILKEGNLFVNDSYQYVDRNS